MYDFIQQYLMDTIDNHELLTAIFSHMTDKDREKMLICLKGIYGVSEDDLYDYYVLLSKK